MAKMFISLESSNESNNEGSVFDSSEPMRSRSAIASYKCKVYRAHLEQGAASQHIVPLFASQPKNARE